MLMHSILGGLPQPPINDAMPKTAETIFNVFIFIPLGAALAIAFRQLRQGRGPLLLYCIIGGALAASCEPVVDVLGLVFLKEHNALGTFTILGRTMPLYICFVYPWYVGGLGYLAYRLFKRGVTARDLFVLWAVDFVIDAALETPGILAHSYLYYGHQPFNIWGFPLWWGFVNPLMPMIAGAALYHLLPRLGGWRMAAVIVIIPMADLIGNATSAFPVWMALNQSDVSYGWSYLAGFVCLGLALFTVWIVAQCVARPTAEVGDLTLLQKLKVLATTAPEPLDVSTHRAGGAG